MLTLVPAPKDEKPVLRSISLEGSRASTFWQAAREGVGVLPFPPFTVKRQEGGIVFRKVAFRRGRRSASTVRLETERN